MIECESTGKKGGPVKSILSSVKYVCVIHHVYPQENVINVTAVSENEESTYNVQVTKTKHKHVH